MGRNPGFQFLALGVLVGAVLLPAEVHAHIVKSVSLTIDDTQAKKCQNVTATVSFCIKVQREDISGTPPTGLAEVMIRLVYDEWGDDSDYEGDGGTVDPVCERTFKVPFLPENIGADICRSNQFLCQFHASTYDYGWTTDPDFYACAKSSLSGAKNKYTGEIEIEFGCDEGLQTESASLMPAETGEAVAMALTPAADLPAGSSGSFVVSVDPRTATLLDAVPPPVTELEPGVWLFQIPDSSGPFESGQPMMVLSASVADDLLYGDQRARAGAGITLSEVNFSDGTAEPVDVISLLAFGYDQDLDGLPVLLESDIDGDGVHDDDDAFPLDDSEVADADDDGLGDAFETLFFLGLSAEPHEDPDGDGSTNLDEFRARTDPTDSDTDSDMVVDGADAFPLDPSFANDADGDLVPDPLDAFPSLRDAAFDTDVDGLGDNWEMFWFGSLVVVDAAGDFDGDTVSNGDEFLADTNPVTVPIVPEFTGGGSDIGGPGVDALLYPLTVNEEGPLTDGTVDIAPGQPTLSVEFGFAEEADLTSLEALWNGESLYGPDGRRQTGDEPFGTLVFDVAYQGFVIRISGLPVAGNEQNQLELSIGSSLDPSDLDVDTLTFVRPAPTCSFGEEDFFGGLRGFCESSGNSFDLVFEDFASNHVYSVEWPGSLVSPPAADCDSLCQAGALAVAYDTNRFNLRRNSQCPAPALLLQCALAPNGSDIGYDLCEGGGKFECFLACGKQCVGCEVEVGEDCGGDGESCKTHEFECYKRDCCVTHDQCLADNAGDPVAELACHVQAPLDGCDFADARGQTHTYNDASCFNPPDQCIEVAPPGPPTQACCIEGPLGSECQDLTAIDCLAAGGQAQGVGTRCTGPDGKPNTGDEPCYTSPTRHEARCLNALNKSARKVSRTATAIIQDCYRDFVVGKKGSAEECAGTAANPGDPKGRLARAVAKTGDVFSKKCEAKIGGPPLFGPQSADQVNNASIEAAYGMYQKMLGSDLDLLPATKNEVSTCILATMKTVARCQDAQFKEFLACAKIGTKMGTITNGAVMRCECLEPSIPDPRGRVDKYCNRGLERAAKKCATVDVDFDSAFGAGDCAGETGEATQVAACIETLVDCEICLWANAANSLETDCVQSCAGN